MAIDPEILRRIEELEDNASQHAMAIRLLLEKIPQPERAHMERHIAEFDALRKGSRNNPQSSEE